MNGCAAPAHLSRALKALSIFFSFASFLSRHQRRRPIYVAARCKTPKRRAGERPESAILVWQIIATDGGLRCAVGRRRCSV
jgi:hypothetical protein